MEFAFKSTGAGAPPVAGVTWGTGFADVGFFPCEEDELESPVGVGDPDGTAGVAGCDVGALAGGIAGEMS